MSKNEQMVGISRRTLVKSTAIGSLALAAGGFSLPFTLRSAEAAVQQANEKVVWGACSVNCGSRCALRLHVKDNEVTWWKLTTPQRRVWQPSGTRLFARSLHPSAY